MYGWYRTRSGHCRSHEQLCTDAGVQQNHTQPAYDYRKAGDYYCLYNFYKNILEAIVGGAGIAIRSFSEGCVQALPSEASAKDVCRHCHPKLQRRMGAGIAIRSFSEGWVQALPSEASAKDGVQALPSEASAKGWVQGEKKSEIRNQKQGTGIELFTLY